MNKQELISHIAYRTRTTKAQTERTIDDLIMLIRERVAKGDDVKIIGLGTFTKQKYKGRLGRNPQTGKQINIPAAWRPKFRAGTDFKEMVRK